MFNISNTDLNQFGCVSDHLFYHISLVSAVYFAIHESGFLLF